MAFKTAACNVRTQLLRLLLTVASMLASHASQAAPCFSLSAIHSPVPGHAGEARLGVSFAPSARLTCIVMKAPYPPAPAISTIAVLTSLTMVALWRREKSFEQINEETQGVRKNPNRWLGKVLGTPPLKSKIASQHLQPALLGNHANRHSLKTGTKHATLRRSRYA